MTSAKSRLGERSQAMPGSSDLGNRQPEPNIPWPGSHNPRPDLARKMIFRSLRQHEPIFILCWYHLYVHSAFLSHANIYLSHVLITLFCVYFVYWIIPLSLQNNGTSPFRSIAFYGEGVLSFQTINSSRVTTVHTD